MHKHLTVFVDTAAFVSLLKADDTTHERAKYLFEKLQKRPVSFLTSNSVFSETVTVLSQRVSHSVAVAYIQTMYAPTNQFAIQRASEDIEAAAIEIFKAQTSKNTSFVDCVNMAFLKQLQADAIFSFDDDYRKNGFPLVEDLLAKEVQAA